MKVGIIVILLIINNLFYLGQSIDRTVGLPDNLRIFYYGLENYSTAPSYVSFIAIDKQTKKKRSVCCLAPSINIYLSKGTASIVNYTVLTVEIESLDANYPEQPIDTIRFSRNGYDLYPIDKKDYLELSSNFGNTLIDFSNRITEIRDKIVNDKLKRKQKVNLEREMTIMEDSIKSFEKMYNLCVPHFYFNYGISTRADCLDGSLILENRLNKIIKPAHNNMQ